MKEEQLEEAFRMFGVMNPGNTLVYRKENEVRGIQFARAGAKDIQYVESLTDKELIDSYKSMVAMLESDYASFSIADLQMEKLYALEIESRGLEW